MSTIYVATELERLAHRLLEQLDARADFFTPTTIAVPNDIIAKWLKLWLAQHGEIAVNLRFRSFDEALWDLLSHGDTRTYDFPPVMLDETGQRLLALSVLWDDDAAQEMAPLRNYVQYGGPQRGRSFCRRAWQLADRLSQLYAVYEYQRHAQIIHRWQHDQRAYESAPATIRRLEESQKAVWQRITRVPHGKRDVLRKSTGRLYMTLPEYADDVMNEVYPELTDANAPSLPATYFFGVTHMSPMHASILQWLTPNNNLQIFHFTPMADWQKTLLTLPQFDSLSKAGQVSYQMLTELLGFDIVELSPEKKPQPATVLTRLQREFLGQECDSRRIEQDRSLQIVACPGAYREVETVCNAILHLLQTDSSLKQTDITVLASDMDLYRPVLQAVFERQQHLRFNIADFTAAPTSVFGQALLGVIDLALESFSRSRMFGVLLNPCFLAALGIERSQTMTWLQWVEQLGVYHGWDKTDQQERGYANTPVYSWQWGLRRLRLGQLMDVSADAASETSMQFGEVIPSADLPGAERENLDAFCRAVEGLLPLLMRWRKREAAGVQWAEELRHIIYQFLEIPDDRPEEKQVRDHVLECLNQFRLLDGTRSRTDSEAKFPLALVREFLQSNLESLRGTRGEALVAGVTIGQLQPMRALPFRVTFVIGLNEELFPGSNHWPAFDLRNQETSGADIRPADLQRYAFLEAVLSTRDKLFLTYTNRNLQTDQVLQPAGPLVQLQQVIDQRIVSEPFQTAHIPLIGTDSAYIDENQKRVASDALMNYRESERVIAIQEALNSGTATLTPRQQKEFAKRNQKPAFSLPACHEEASDAPILVSLRELTRFLRCPAEAALRRHLRLREAEEWDMEDDEPFRTGFPENYQIVRAFLDRFIKRSMEHSVDEAIGTWPARFESFYDDWQMCGRVPEGAFGKVDRDAFAEQLRGQLDRTSALTQFLAARPPEEFCGPIAIGPSLNPVGARLRFPALSIPHQTAVHLVGETAYVWRNQAAIDMLVITQKARTNAIEQHLSRSMLEPVLFYLALQAGTDPAHEGHTSQQWVGERTLHLHLACNDGLVEFAYPPMDAQTATTYLTDLVHSFLDTACFDMLPFDIIVATDLLRAAYIDENDPPDEVAQYPDLLRDALLSDQEGDHPKYRPSSFVELVNPSIPDDAWSKIRKRFRLLDLGPKRKREAE